MSSNRGARPGERRGGRQKGTPNRKTAEQVAAVAATGITPLDFMLAVMRDTKRKDDVRLDAAKAAAQYVHPKLSAIDANVTGKFSIGDALDALDDSGD